MTNPLLDPDRFQAWRDQPLTQGFLAYLKDRRSDLMEAWAKEFPLGLAEQREAALLGQLAEISFEHIAEQYGAEVKHDDDSN